MAGKRTECSGQALNCLGVPFLTVKRPIVAGLNDDRKEDGTRKVVAPPAGGEGEIPRSGAVNNSINLDRLAD